VQSYHYHELLFLFDMLRDWSILVIYVVCEHFVPRPAVVSKSSGHCRRSFLFSPAFTHCQAHVRADEIVEDVKQCNLCNQLLSGLCRCQCFLVQGAQTLP
jgi:hypothetical protein